MQIVCVIFIGPAHCTPSTFYSTASSASHGSLDPTPQGSQHVNNFPSVHSPQQDRVRFYSRSPVYNDGAHPSNPFASRHSPPQDRVRFYNRSPPQDRFRFYNRSPAYNNGALPWKPFASLPTSSSVRRENVSPDYINTVWPRTPAYEEFTASEYNINNLTPNAMMNRPAPTPTPTPSTASTIILEPEPVIEMFDLDTPAKELCDPKKGIFHSDRDSYSIINPNKDTFCCAAEEMRYLYKPKKN